MANSETWMDAMNARMEELERRDTCEGCGNVDASVQAYILLKFPFDPKTDQPDSTTYWYCDGCGRRPHTYA